MLAIKCCDDAAHDPYTYNSSRHAVETYGRGREGKSEKCLRRPSMMTWTAVALVTNVAIRVSVPVDFGWMIALIIMVQQK